MTTVLGLIGYGLLVIGSAMLSLWLGIIVAGLVMLVIAYSNETEPAK